ncbi:MAG: T9SS type A sorting domain-containing protein [Bacteroidetes bacterium]|nr:T9SS type A sorting domain-containing protein [Bacteroidota bacterium]
MKTHHTPHTTHTHTHHTHTQCLVAKFRLVLLFSIYIMSTPTIFAQFNFPSSKPTLYTERDSLNGLWQPKYEVSTDTQYYNIHDLEMEDGIKSDFPISKTPDLMVIQYTPIIKDKGERLLDGLLPPKLPTIFIVPGGGFFLPWIISEPLVTNGDDCTSGLPALLTQNGYKVIVFHYFVNENDPPLLRMFDIDVNIFGVPLQFPIRNQIITPQVADKYRFEQASIRSFWSFRKVMRTDYLNKADTLGIDTTKMIIAAHSAGAILALYNTFLNSAEIPTDLCGGLYANCAIQSAWRTDYFNLPKFRGVMAMAGASKFDNIFDNDFASINAAGTKLLLMHGTCDELLNEHGGKVPWRNNMPERDLYAHAFSLPDRYTQMIGSASIFKKLAGKITVRFEEGCEAGHDLTKQASYLDYGDPLQDALNHGTWNFCDQSNTLPSNINTNHFVYNKILDFANRVLFNSPSAFTSAFTRFDPELPYFECPDTTTICTPTNILYTFNNADCNKRILQLQGGACLDKAILYFWRFKTLPSGTWSAYQYTTAPQFDLSAFPPNNAYTVVDVVALNACDTVYKRDTIQFCNLCVGGCNPNRLANQATEGEQIISFQYPNNLTVSSTMEGMAQLQMIDIKGVIITQWTTEYQLGENKISIPINLNAQPPGMYFVRSMINHTTQSIKIIIP